MSESSENLDKNENLPDSSRAPLQINQADAALSADPLIGYELAERYKIVEFIASGGWGSVYKGKHLTLGSDIAVKIIHKHLTEDEGNLKRLEQEARLLSRLESPNIVRLLDYGLVPLPYIVMEYFDGVPLNKWLKANGFLKADLAVELFLQICEGLNNAHALGLVHRDLKPANIMIKIENGKIKSKILDFGIAKLIDEHERLTSTGEILGSPPYMSPEQWKGRTDSRSDLYSLGCIMYEALCGKQAFNADYGLDYLNKHMSFTPLKMREVEPLVGLPSSMEDLLRKCLEKSPERRYQSAEEIHADLERVKAGRKLHIQIEKDRIAARKKIFLVSAFALSLFALLLFLQKEPLLTAYSNYLNSLADKEKARANFKEAIADYRKSILISKLLSNQAEPKLHAMRMLANCLKDGAENREAQAILKELDLIIGAGPFAELDSLYRRIHYQLEQRADSKTAIEKAEEACRLAETLAGKKSLAYSQSEAELARALSFDARSSAVFAPGSPRDPKKSDAVLRSMKLQDESLKIAETLLEPDDIIIAERLNGLGSILYSAGKLHEAKEAFARALAISTKQLSFQEKSQAEKGLNEPLIIADFNSASKPNNIGADFNTWERDPNDKTQGCRFSFSNDDAESAAKGKSLCLDYDVDSPNQSYCGFWMKLAGEDFSGYNALNLYLKGDSKLGFTKSLKIELKDISNKASPYFISDIKEQWQLVSIPFYKFKMISDWSRMNEFVVVFEDLKSRPKIGRIYIDQISISKQSHFGIESNSAAQSAAAYNGLGSIKIAEKNAGAALNCFKKAYELCRTFTNLDQLETLNNLACAYMELGEKDKALDNYMKALAARIADGSSQCPDTEYLCNSIGDIYFQKNDFQQAQSYFEQGLNLRKLGPKNSEREKILLEKLAKCRSSQAFQKL
ncbi:MAG: protein kinase [Candidatus Obscuribacterales bacterium]|nr:protein kinase [Candidatus Obscuribacterales bacterium]